jgi:hypothetical protein
MAHDHAFFAKLICRTSVTWTKDIQQMFTSVDIAHMQTKGIDLSNYQSVSINAVPIYTQVANGGMPPAGTIGPDGKPELPWPAEKVNTFGCWIQQGCPQ